MNFLKNVDITRVLEIFKSICKIPHGSGNCEKMADFCVDFAKKNSLTFFRDEKDNVIIYKEASSGYEDAEPIILQGHLDMVCQKTEDSKIDFEKDGIEIYQDGDFLRAKKTTLGADNGIAVAMVLSVLESKEVKHPRLEAVFTSDEEIGMLGANALDVSNLSGKRLINLDSEEDDTVTVSCAGGSDVEAVIAKNPILKSGKAFKVILKGLRGGHSGVEIAAHRVNSNVLMGRVLNNVYKKAAFEIISLSGGTKANAIPNYSEALVLPNDSDEFTKHIEEYLLVVKNEISHREPDFEWEIIALDENEYEVFSFPQKIISALLCCPNGIMEMSSEIEGLPQTSLNLGILISSRDGIKFGFALRSCKADALKALEEKVVAFFSLLDADIKTGGYYPPWEYNEDSFLRKLYVETYTDAIGEAPKVEAIHAGLECAIFSSSIKNVDCIAIGPTILGAHTVLERLSIPSVRKVYSLLVRMLAKANNY